MMKIFSGAQRILAVLTTVFILDAAIPPDVGPEHG